MKPSRKNYTGFTLIEVLIAMLLVGVISGALYSLYITNQRSAYTTDEAVEVQQNLRIAIEAVTRDLRMAGFIMNKDESPNGPIDAIVNDNPGNPRRGNELDLTPGGPRTSGNAVPAGSDSITLNTGTASNVYGRCAEGYEIGSTAPIKLAPPLTVGSSKPVHLFDNSNADVYIRIIRYKNGNFVPLEYSATNPAAGMKKLKPFPNGVDFVNDTIQLDSGLSFNEQINAGDRVVLAARVTPIGSPLTPPTTINQKIQYSLVNCTPPTASQLFCLERRINGEQVIVAQNIADFQLRYVLDDESVVDTTPNLADVKAVIVSIWGQTEATRMLSGNTPKIRQLTAMVKLGINRNKQ